MTGTSPQRKSSASRVGASQLLLGINRQKPHTTSAGLHQDAYLQAVTSFVSNIYQQGDPGSVQEFFKQVKAHYPGAKLIPGEMIYHEQVDPVTGDIITVCVEEPDIVVPDSAQPTNPVVVAYTVTVMGPFPPVEPGA